MFCLLTVLLLLLTYPRNTHVGNELIYNITGTAQRHSFPLAARFVPSGQQIFAVKC